MTSHSIRISGYAVPFKWYQIWRPFYDYLLCSNGCKPMFKQWFYTNQLNLTISSKLQLDINCRPTMKITQMLLKLRWPFVVITLKHFCNNNSTTFMIAKNTCTIILRNKRCFYFWTTQLCLPVENYSLGNFLVVW